MYKRNKSDYIEQTDNMVAESSKTQNTRSKITRSSRWENPVGNIQKDKPCVENPQDGQSHGSSSKKRKSFDDIEIKLSESSNKSSAGKSYETGRNKLTACRRSTRNKKSGFSEIHTKYTFSAADLQSTKNESDVNLDLKIISKSTTDESYRRSETEKSRSTISETIKPNSNRRIGPKQKISAQSRLISKRKEFEIAAKKALNSFTASNSSNLLMEIEKQETVKVLHSSEKNPNYNNSSSRASASVAARIRNRVQRHLREQKGKVDDLNDVNTLDHGGSGCMDEEMDWEPSEQEVMIEHIKKMRRDCGNVEKLSNDIAIYSNGDMETTQDDSVLILVFDTNVFISCLPFIKEIRDTSIPVLGFPKLMIPWRVLQELDRLKTSDIKPLQVSAIRAIRFLNENFSSRHSRVMGQSFEECVSLVEGSSSCPDDEILKLCLCLKKKDQSKIVILITNDKNLESKALVSGVEAFSKDRFVKEKLRSANKRVSGMNTGSKARNVTLKSDMAYCRLKGALKKFLEQLLETEFVNAFSKDWKKVVAKKPPWRLMDIFECLIKHWRSVFHFIFKKDVLTLIEDLKDYFQKVETEEITGIKEIAEVSKELLERMAIYVSTDKPYSKLLNETLREVEMWVGSTNPPKADNMESQINLPLSPVPSSSQEPPVACNPHFDVALCKDKVKSLFQTIWDQVNAFFCRVSELAATNGMNNPDAVYETKTQFPHVIHNVQGLVEIVEKLLSLGPEDKSRVEIRDKSQFDEVILHLTNFLVSLNIFQMDPAEMNNLPGYIGLFCGDNDGRIVLCTLVNDLRQFVMGMMDGMKVLERL